MGKLAGRFRRDTAHAAPKMSAILLDVAEPVLNGLTLPNHRDLFESMLLLGATLWNLSRLPDETQRASGLKDVIDEANGSGVKGMEPLIRETYQRCRQLYPSDKRLIKHQELVV